MTEATDEDGGPRKSGAPGGPRWPELPSGPGSGGAHPSASRPSRSPGPGGSTPLPSRPHGAPWGTVTCSTAAVKRHVRPARCLQAADGKCAEAPSAGAGDDRQGTQGHGAPRTDRGPHALAWRAPGACGDPARGRGAPLDKRRHPCGERRTSASHRGAHADTPTFTEHFRGPGTLLSLTP